MIMHKCDWCKNDSECSGVQRSECIIGDYFRFERELNEFELDDKAAARISRVIQQNAMTLNHCADVLEAVAPYCTLWTTDGFLKRLCSAFTLYQLVNGWDMKGRG